MLSNYCGGGCSCGCGGGGNTGCGCSCGGNTGCSCGGNNGCGGMGYEFVGELVNFIVTLTILQSILGLICNWCNPCGGFGN